MEPAVDHFKFCKIQNGIWRMCPGTFPGLTGNLFTDGENALGLRAPVGSGNSTGTIVRRL